MVTGVANLGTTADAITITTSSRAMIADSRLNRALRQSGRP